MQRQSLKTANNAYTSFDFDSGEWLEEAAAQGRTLNDKAMTTAAAGGGQWRRKPVMTDVLCHSSISPGRQRRQPVGKKAALELHGDASQPWVHV